MNTLPVLDDIVTRLSERLPGLHVAYFPDSPDAFTLTHPAGAVLLSYRKTFQIWICRTTAPCRSDFSRCTAWMDSPATLYKATALLARWFRWQPGEIEALTVDDLEAYLDEAGEQIRREYGGG